MKKPKDCHPYHDTVTVDSAVGKFVVYDTKRYRKPNCPANDPISKAIKKSGGWSQETTNELTKILSKAKHKRKLFVDYGAHIGWFTVLAALMDFDVVAFESNVNHAVLLSDNADLTLTGNVYISQEPITENTKPANVGKPFKEIYCAKIDMDGADVHAVNMLDNLLRKRKVRYVVIAKNEELVSRIEKYGYLLIAETDQDVIFVKKSGIRR